MRSTGTLTVPDDDDPNAMLPVYFPAARPAGFTLIRPVSGVAEPVVSTVNQLDVTSCWDFSGTVPGSGVFVAFGVNERPVTLSRVLVPMKF